MSETDQQHTGQGRNDYTDSEIRVRPLFIFLMICLVVTGLTLVGVNVLFKQFRSEVEAADDLVNNYSLERQLPDGTATLQGFQQAALDLKALHDEEDARLNHYAWVDQAGGVVQIPIERAMERIVEVGLPIREGAAEQP